MLRLTCGRRGDRLADSAQATTQATGRQRLAPSASRAVPRRRLHLAVQAQRPGARGPRPSVRKRGAADALLLRRSGRRRASPAPHLDRPRRVPASKDRPQGARRRARARVRVRGGTDGAQAGRQARGLGAGAVPAHARIGAGGRLTGVPHRQTGPTHGLPCAAGGVRATASALRRRLERAVAALAPGPGRSSSAGGPRDPRPCATACESRCCCGRRWLLPVSAGETLGAAGTGLGSCQSASQRHRCRPGCARGQLGSRHHRRRRQQQQQHRRRRGCREQHAGCTLGWDDVVTVCPGPDPANGAAVRPAQSPRSHCTRLRGRGSSAGTTKRSARAARP
mmetsp:Transcript_18048/g.68130  ORF Transcript_18048/g.68130 Transcript_18048/m.68130 type:complete len:337 (-) Transcript_18048:2233-3243(-)